MADSDHKIPRFPPLVPPRPTAPANRELEKQAIVELKRRQSDHEIKVGDDVAAMATHLRRRELFDRDVAASITVLAGELGVAERLPESLRPLPQARAKTEPPALYENAQKSARKAAQGARGTYLAIVLLVLEILLELSRHR